MSITCDICGEWSPGTGFGHRDICLPCFEHNFSGNPLDAPTAREALDASVDAAGPYQRAALARLHASWRWQEEDRHDL